MSMRDDMQEILFTQEDLADIVKRLGQRISEDYKLADFDSAQRGSRCHGQYSGYNQPAGLFLFDNQQNQQYHRPNAKANDQHCQCKG